MTSYAHHRHLTQPNSFTTCSPSGVFFSRNEPNPGRATQRQIAVVGSHDSPGSNTCFHFLALRTQLSVCPKSDGEYQFLSIAEAGAQKMRGSRERLIIVDSSACAALSPVSPKPRYETNRTQFRKNPGSPQSYALTTLIQTASKINLLNRLSRPHNRPTGEPSI